MWSKLEQTFLRTLGPTALTKLASIPLPTQRFLITVGGDQLTGKSSLTRALTKSSVLQSVVNGRIAHRSTGQTMRDLAAERGVGIGELSNILAQNSADDGAIVDVNLDYKTCEVVLGKYENDASMLVLEGRQPAVMASFCSEQVPTNTQIPFRVYLKCSVREQALRYVGREVSEVARMEVEKYLPSNEMYETMEDVLERIQGQVFLGQHGKMEEIVAGFRTNMDRDADDKVRFDQLYGEECHYRNEKFYDLVVDTSFIEEEEKLNQVSSGWMEWLVENNFGIRQ